MNHRRCFYVGCERSGTTLFRLMLSQNPAIHTHPEFTLAVERVGDDGRFPEMEEFHRWVENLRVFRSCRHEIDRTLSYPELVDSFLEQEKQKSGKPLVIGKVHSFFDRLPFVWQEAKYIHLIRDGRDVAPSLIGKNWCGNVYTAAQRWKVAEDAWDRLEARIRPEQWIETRFEKLVSDPAGEMKRVCDFLGVAYDPQMVDVSKSSTYQDPDATKASKWRHALTRSEVRTIEAVCGDILDCRGYEASGYPRATVGRLRAAFLRAHSRWKTRIGRLKKFGFLNSLLYAAARRFGHRSLADRLKRRFDDIEKATFQ